MKRYVLCSGGKDSMATVILCYENNIHVDGVVIAEVMFDKKRNISAEHPEHVEWLYNVAIPIIEQKFGYKVIVLRSESDYVQHFHTRIAKSKHPERIGKKRGFVLGGNKCALKRDLKTKVINDWLKKHKECEKIFGIAYDEPERLASMHKLKNQRSVLEEHKIVEAQTFDIDRKYGLLSPFYSSGRKRQGCWFCPNASITEMAQFAKKYPEFWNELRILAQDDETVSKYFQYNRTFQEIDRAVTAINLQIDIFDLGVV